MNEKIKILFRHRSMEMGGVEKVMINLLNGLSRDKFEMTTLLNIDQGELRNEIPKHVKKVTLAMGKEDFSKNPLLQKVQLAKRKIRLNNFAKHPEKISVLLEDNYDIEIAMDYRDYKSVLSSPNKKAKKIAWFHSEINIPGFRPLVPLVLESFPHFDHIVYCSQRTKDLMHKYYPSLNYPPESVIINAIPIDEIKQKAEEPAHDFPQSNIPTFIAIGRLHSRKGFHKLMEAHARLIQEGYEHKVIILGDGEEKENLQKGIANHNISDTFFLLGNKMNPYPYLKRSDFFIMPSESEAWPLVLAEALILQKPSIATDSGDVSTMLEHGRTGLLISYEENEIYRAMKDFLSKPELIEEIKENLKDSEKQFNNQKIFDAVEEIIINLAKK